MDMKKYFKKFLFFIIFVGCSSFGFYVFAEEGTINNDVITPEDKKETDPIIPPVVPSEEPVVMPEPFSVSAQVDVPKTCSVVDTNGETHTYGDNSSDSYLGICALSVALSQGDISNVGLSNEYPELGLFVISFDGVAADPASEYWALYQNGEFASSGISTLPVIASDTISFKLSDFGGTLTGDQVDITINSLLTDDNLGNEGGDDQGSEGDDNNTSGNFNNGSNSGSSSGGETSDDFSLEEAITFLLSNQSDDGSFGDDLYTDWVAIGLAKLDLDDDEILKNVKNYLKNDEIDSSSITESERRAMALMALGIDPKDGTDEDYIENIVSSFDGQQIGDEELFNDDIFALIVLSHAGFEKDNEMIKKIVSFIISNQSDDGSWGSVDMTSAAIQALKNFKKLDGASSSISLGEEYLLEEQEDDGGFKDVYSTSWAVQALSLNNSLDEEREQAVEYLKNLQEDDGSMTDGDTNSKVWATVYALPAIYSLSWNDILESFSYEEDNQEDSSVDEVVEPEIIEEEKEVLIPDEKIVNEEIKVEVKKDTNTIVKPNIPQVEENKIDESDTSQENMLGASVASAPSSDDSVGFWVSIFDFFAKVWMNFINIFI